MTFVDIHAHLDFDSIISQKDEMEQNMKERNIYAISNTLNFENYIKTKELYKNSTQIKVIPGLYPTDAVTIKEEDFQKYLQYLRKHQDDFIAIGEIGLDGKEITNADELLVQEERFKQMIELAIEIDKPVIIHTRKRELRVLEIIEEFIEKTGFRKFDLHCFCGKKKLLTKIKELKIYCSIPLIILNTESFKFIVEELNISQLLVETDSPFLHPEKKVNTPLEIPKIYEKIAEIKGYDLKEIENIIYRNYMKFIN